LIGPDEYAGVVVGACAAFGAGRVGVRWQRENGGSLTAATLIDFLARGTGTGRCAATPHGH
jgi:hypothetical protein